VHLGNGKTAKVNTLGIQIKKPEKVNKYEWKTMK
jgi:hypothetical protein